MSAAHPLDPSGPLDTSDLALLVEFAYLGAGIASGVPFDKEQFGRHAGTDEATCPTCRATALFDRLHVWLEAGELADIVARQEEALLGDRELMTAIDASRSDPDRLVRRARPAPDSVVPGQDTLDPTKDTTRDDTQDDRRDGTGDEEQEDRRIAARIVARRAHHPAGPGRSPVELEAALGLRPEDVAARVAALDAEWRLAPPRDAGPPPPG